MSEEAVVSAYQGGQSLRQIAKSLGVAHSHIWKILDRHGVSRRPVGQPKNTRTGKRGARR